MAVEVLTENFLLGGNSVCLELTADNRGLISCILLDKQVQVSSRTDNRFLMQAAEDLQRYFGGMLQKFNTHVAPDGTLFQQQVWTATATIPFGEMRSYAWVAEQIGNPKAVRAVAQALGANPLLLFVPCHRVIRSDGSIGGFSCGLHWKHLLLAREGVSLPLQGSAHKTLTTTRLSTSDGFL